jgi:hypothetical protein
MKLTQYFGKMLTETVNLNGSRLADLDTRVVRITEALKAADSLGDRVLDTVPQGSWAHETIIRPAAGLEFDADFLVQLSEDDGLNENPRSYANAVYAALSGHPIYGAMSSKKDRCVRVTYANDCHVDIITYVVMANGRQVIVNRHTNEFEDTNPVGFSEWIQEKDRLTNGNLRKAIRLLKYLRDHQDTFRLKSVLLTTLVGSIVDSWRDLNGDYYKDVPTTLLHLVEDLDRWLQAQWSKPHLSDPSCLATSFDHRWTDSQFVAFRDKIHELAAKIREAFDASTVDESIAAWRQVFGPAFPEGVVTAAPVSASASVRSATGGRAPKEQFIEEMFPLQLTDTVSVRCDVSPPRELNRVQRRALRAGAGIVPKQRDLYFAVEATTVEGRFDVYWKVRNSGFEAEKQQSLRGEITRDAGQRRKKESTLYAGNHYVECYVIKNGICVARSREPVVIM